MSTTLSDQSAAKFSGMPRTGSLYIAATMKFTIISSLCYLLMTALHVKDIAILNNARQLTEQVLFCD
jgi:hypothetical protein